MISLTSAQCNTDSQVPGSRWFMMPVWIITWVAALVPTSVSSPSKYATVKFWDSPDSCTSQMNYSAAVNYTTQLGLLLGTCLPYMNTAMGSMIVACSELACTFQTFDDHSCDFLSNKTLPFALPLHTCSKYPAGGTAMVTLTDEPTRGMSRPLISAYAAPDCTGLALNVLEGGHCHEGAKGICYPNGTTSSCFYESTTCAAAKLNECDYLGKTGVCKQSPGYARMITCD